MTDEVQAQAPAAETVAESAPSSLLDLAGDTTTQATDEPTNGVIHTESAVATTGADWNWDDGVGGEGSKP